MQWLIDLVIEAIGIPPCAIYRGDPASTDVEKADFLVDGAFHNLDLSSIVPAGAKLVLFTLTLKSDAASKYTYWKMKGQTNNANRTTARTQSAGIIISYDCQVFLSEDRMLEYRIQAALWITISLTVKGWIL